MFKKIIMVVGIVLMFSFAYASPFLVCDPDEKTTSYIVIMDGGGPVEVHAPLHFDLGGIADGSHIVEVQGKNLWGVSVPSPLEFTKQLPPSITNIRLSTE